MSSTPNTYSFYFSLRGNGTIPAHVIWLFTSVGMIAMTLSYWLKSLTASLILLLYPIMFFLIKQHFQIDFNNKTCRMGVDYLGFTVGKWIPLPPIEYVSVFKKQFSNKKFEDGGGLNWEDTYEKIEVNLIINKRKTITAWTGDNKGEAMRAAKFIAKNLDIKVLDATHPNFEWIE